MPDQLEKHPFIDLALVLCASFVLLLSATTRAQAQSSPATETLKEKLDRYVEKERIDDGVYLITRGLLGPDGKGIPSYVCPFKDRQICVSPPAKGSADGIIFMVPEDTEVVASASGTVEDVENYKDTEDGFTIRIKHWNGTVSSYSRLHIRSVKIGDEVTQGEVVAKSGKTGTTNTPSLVYRLMDPSGHPLTPSWGYERTPYDPGSLTDPRLLKEMEARARLMFPVNQPYEADIQNAVIEKIRLIFAQNQELQRAIYSETLRDATDAWYANEKNWRKIPPDIWNKLTETDRGRLRNGIDPGLAVSPTPSQPRHN